jgi:hypothetical protein
MARAFLIDPEKREVTEVDFNPPAQRVGDLLGCDAIGVAYSWGLREPTLYVDDEGLLHSPKHFFTFVPRMRYTADPLAGKGLIVGAEWETEDPPAWGVHDVPFTKQQVEHWVAYWTLSVVVRYTRSQGDTE